MKKKPPPPVVVMPSTVPMIDSSFSQAQLGREKVMPPLKDTSSCVTIEPSPVKIEDHETAAATCPGEANTSVDTGGQVKTEQVAQPDKVNQPAISSEPAKVNDLAEVVDPQEDNRSEPAERNQNQPVVSFAQAKVGDSAELVDPKEENKPEAGGALDWLMALALSSLPRQEKAILPSLPRQENAAPSFKAGVVAPVLSSLPRQEKASHEDEKISRRTDTNFLRDPAIDLERKLNAINDIRASITAKNKKSSYAPCGSSYFDEPETIEAMDDMGDTRNNDEIAKSLFSKRKAANANANKIETTSDAKKSAGVLTLPRCGNSAKPSLSERKASSSLSPSIHDIGLTLEKSVFRESTDTKSTMRGFDALSWSSSEDGSTSTGSVSAMTQVSSLAGTDGVSVRSSRTSRSSRSRGTNKSTRKDKKIEKQSMKEAEESIKRAEEALAGFKQHAQRLRNEEQDRLLKGSRSRGTGKSTPKEEISDEQSLKEVEQSTEHVEEALAFFKQHAQRLGC
jgi:hypothetical protein